MAKQQKRFLKDLAQGAILAAKNQDKVPELMDDLRLFGSVLQSDAQVRVVLTNTLVPVERRYAALKQVLGEQLEPLTLKTLELLLQRNLLAYFDDFASLMENTARETANYHLCRVQSAVVINDKDRQLLKQVLEKKFSGTVKLLFELNPTVIGGLSVTCGDWRYLGTIQAKLQQLSHHLITN